MSFERRTIAYDEWVAEGRALFGDDPLAWRFVCPCCGHEASVADWKAAGAPETAAAFSCVGRWSGAKREAFGGKGPGPCNYAGGGLFCISPVEIQRVVDGQQRSTMAFEFAKRQAAGEGA